MRYDKHTPNISPSSSAPTQSLRLRPSTRSALSKKTNNPSKQGNLKQECYSALLPVLLICMIWCFGCYVYLWIHLFESLHNDIDDHGDHIRFHKTKDILEIRLEQFLTGDSYTAEEDSDASWNFQYGGVANQTRHFNITLLQQMVDPAIATTIQSTLLAQTGYPNLLLGAYLEPPLQMEKEKMKLRTHTPEQLRQISYPYQQYIQTKKSANQNEPMPGACSQQGAQWIFPTFHPKSLDHIFESNVFKKHPNFEKRWELSPHCPVDADPFLPWIHDAFPSNGHIELIISNKRRCNTDPKVFRSDLQNLEPQIALMQPVPIKRTRGKDGPQIDDALSKLWSPYLHGKQESSRDGTLLAEDYVYSPPRYVLGTSLDDADGDGNATRFICRFHTLALNERGNETSDKLLLQKIVLGETLSNYPYNPEHANYRKRGSQPMLTSLEKGHDEQLWNSVYTVRCPIPVYTDNSTNNTLERIIASGKSVVRGSPSLYLDLVPIRTPTRHQREGFALPGVTSTDNQPMFDPRLVWGEAHVLPLVEASGRWTNIPICRPPERSQTVDSKAEQASIEAPKEDAPTRHIPGENHNKTHFLIACVWASASFSTRGQTSLTDSSTGDRLKEFITYHTKIAGFDHVYVYDNSPNTSSLENVTDLFPPLLVTRIPWNHRLCNNNRPMHSNPGERSSQYAAENSCRARYGPHTTWLASLDVDEYLIPTGKQWGSIRQFLEHVNETEKSTQILSFFQTRALPNIDLMIPYEGESTSACQVGTDFAASSAVLNSMCVMKDPHKTYLQTYNCEPTELPKPKDWAWRAKKQIYKPDFVLNHFVHYPVVTRRIIDKPFESSLRFYERSPFERRVNELTEGFMLHSKTTGAEMTSRWQEQCLRKGSTMKKNPCKVGIASPTKILGDEKIALAEGNITSPSYAFASNCYRHGRVMNEWVPKLEAALRSIETT